MAQSPLADSRSRRSHVPGSTTFLRKSGRVPLRPLCTRPGVTVAGERWQRATCRKRSLMVRCLHAPSPTLRSCPVGRYRPNCGYAADDQRPRSPDCRLALLASTTPKHHRLVYGQLPHPGDVGSSRMPRCSPPDTGTRCHHRCRPTHTDTASGCAARGVPDLLHQSAHTALLWCPSAPRLIAQPGNQ
jgi:hypothetical protein